ncbi:ABC transporter permease subunit [Bacillus sp. RG28]|uniref:ABC transporter permease subunit n=1 Tax=Gottfriedia endophytica TaxID=2820819 RepID=A0A940NS80_9BACI|nr:ABC transporter permease [Gottfriedia endophytica]MBP0726578.1 ABC transporter permease subunit [Gottfriedia endophytica]
MLKLVRNELMKIFNRPGTFVMIGILIILTSVVGGIVKYNQNHEDVKVNENWKKEYQTEIKSNEKQIQESKNNQQIDFLKKDIALKEYRIKHNLSPNENYNVWSFVNDASSMISTAGLFTIIIAAGIVASEFNWGTIKLLLIRPINRGKILASKYISIILFALLLLIILYSYSSILGVILFGTPDKAAPYLNYFDGKITEQSMALHLMISYGLKSINMIMLATAAFMVSTVFRNSSLATGLSIALMFTGSTITFLLASKFDWAKYILFANTDLTQYFEGTPMVEGMTLTFSIIMIAIYFVLFQFLAFFVFKKRDVAA